MSEVQKGCLTCVNYVSSMCKLPPEGKEYCLANGEYECWQSADEETINKVTSEMEAAQEAEALNDLHSLVGEEEKKIAMMEKLQDGKNFKGFNGVPIVPGAPPKAQACEKCDHFSGEVGCFLHKYTECVTNGRYLYSQTVPQQPQP